MNQGTVGAIISVHCLSACGDSPETETRNNERDIIFASEAFIDAFYSFDTARLEATLSSAKESVPTIVYYQGWAKGGNYEILNRMPCKAIGDQQVSCSITVRDDLVEALGGTYNATDTFTLTFYDGKIVSVENGSNDPQVFWDAEEWVLQNRSELVNEPCIGFFDGGPTPGLCVKAMVQGYAEFAASDEFPESL